ncbi:MAG: AhpC/TSA family protein [Rhodothermaceae bacterium]|nr:AhpC/TSA family protein [Rhodothermaceae bacterium]
MNTMIAILTTITLLFFITIITGGNSGTETESDRHVPDSAFGVNPLLIGQSVPALEALDKDGNRHSITELTSRKPTLIIFYRGGWCPFCSAHLAELAVAEEEIYNLGYQVLAISPDQPSYLRRSFDEVEMKYTLLSDSSMDIARAFGVAFRADAETVAALKQHGMDIEAQSGQDHHQLPVPAVFITDTDGKIRFQYVNPDYKERISGDILMAALKTFQELP